MTEPVVRVDDLSVTFDAATPVPAVRGVSFQVAPGEVLGIVGESGSGKSVTALALMGLLPASATVSGSVTIAGAQVVGASDRALSQLRGRKVAMVFQDPLSAFTPVYRIGEQLAEAVMAHQKVSGQAARSRAVELLDLVGIPDARVRADAFPHEFSGGMRQRAMIAMAIANDPDVLVADEPTTALDVTIQAQILDVLRQAQQQTGAALVLISHDLGVIAGSADRVAVMYAGKVVESAPVGEFFRRPVMPYSLGLIGAVPRIDRAESRPLVPIPGSPPSPTRLPSGCPFSDRCPLVEPRCREAAPDLRAIAGDHTVACHRAEHVIEHSLTPDTVYHVPAAPPARPATGVEVLRVDRLTKTFPLLKGSVFKRRVGTVYPVDGVDLTIRTGETLGLVGESGAGKSTTLFEILAMTRVESGTVTILGQRTDQLSASAEHALRADVQIVFQDPMGSLDPRMPVGDIIAEPLRAQRADRADIGRRVPELLKLVGLSPADATRFPHEFSGGQRQRISIARALSVRPRLLVLDEPVSALDVSIQAGILNLLQRLKTELGLSYLFVSHDLSVIRHLADRVAVMYLGRTIESGEVDRVFDRPAHPYTRALLSAVPVPDPEIERARERVLLPGDPPSPTRRHTGCRFRDRCPLHLTLDEDDAKRCRTTDPDMIPVAGQHAAACHFTSRV
ncbi:ABC transporter ATP-binding protein [Fodinicola acaciae]|uniref:dipeptide ABC transporter ATP-binding protein n=1 Tax=Fodinicola acaciae TaxID=2681555 RepID=UPI0013D7A441|nr:ABC transporter ATP-binding protein [Fodinicola acaciae]